MPRVEKMSLSVQHKPLPHTVQPGGCKGGQRKMGTLGFKELSTVPHKTMRGKARFDQPKTGRIEQKR